MSSMGQVQGFSAQRVHLTDGYLLQEEHEPTIHVRLESPDGACLTVAFPEHDQSVAINIKYHPNTPYAQAFLTGIPGTTDKILCYRTTIEFAARRLFQEADRWCAEPALVGGVVGSWTLSNARAPEAYSVAVLALGKHLVPGDVSAGLKQLADII